MYLLKILYFSYFSFAYFFYIGELKEILLKEVKQWFSTYGTYINQKYHDVLIEISDYIEDKDKKLSLPIHEFQDVSRVMNCFEDIQENFYRIDMSFKPLKVSFCRLRF